MSSNPTRRELLRSASCATAFLGLAPWLAAAHSRREERGALYEISLAQWSLHRTIRAGALDNLDFAATAKRDYGITAVEYVNGFFFDKATDFDYLTEMKSRAADAGVKNVLIMIDREGALAAEDEQARKLAVEKHYKWVVAARFLGCHSIRVNAAGSGDPREQMRRAADSLNSIAHFAEQYDVNVIVENHGGLSSNGEWLAGVMKLADNPRVGTLPDFGNFRIKDGEWYDRYKGVQELMPYAKAVSAKTHEFDAEGNETKTDYRKMMKIVVDAGYAGHVGIEYEGSKHSESDGIRYTKKLLEQVRAELADSQGDR